jgi:hypothetical protein
MFETKGLTKKESMQSANARALMLLNLLVILASAGCGSVSVEPLMPTPVLYTISDFAPLDHIPEHERWVPRRVYYATDRARTSNVQEIAYGNTQSNDVSVGMALIGFGGPSMTWSDLDRKSRMGERDKAVKLSIAGILETGRFAAGTSPAQAAGPQAAGWLLEDLNDTIADSRDKDLLAHLRSRGKGKLLQRLCVRRPARSLHGSGYDVDRFLLANAPDHLDICVRVRSPTRVCLS